MSNIVKIQETPVATITPDNLLSIAVEKGADIDKLEKLMDLKERNDAAMAKKDFDAAMSGFQADLLPIVKTKQAHNSKYADIDDIAKSIRPLAEKFGLSYRFEQKQENANITVTCIVSHLSGHSESAEFTAPADTSGGKNAIQSLASTVTYLRRYTLTGALGITTGDDDNDGGKPEITVDELLAYNNIVREEIHSIAAVKMHLADNSYSLAKEAWTELGQDLQIAIWRAPTKGGILTTEERTKMKSNQWSQA